MDTLTDPTTDTAPSRPDVPVLLIDGVCSLCEGATRFILDHEREDAPPLQFGSLQDETAKPLLAVSRLPEDYLEGVVLVGPEQTWTSSDAALEIMRRLRQPWPAVAAFGRWVPRPMREAIYRWVARNRYRWFGTKDVCGLPTAAERRRML
ncbi:MAG: DCC1-like thiol-disulfide oxidoreductase family protein [Bacteroidota bacterium]